MYKVFFKTLGCPKNEVDSEYMSGSLKIQDNFKIVDKAKKSDVIVVNTCGFINDAKEESIETIFDAVYYKDNGYCSAVIVTGCLTQRYFEQIKKEIPEIDAILGTGNFDRIAEVIESVMNGNNIYEVSDDPSFDYKSSLPRNYSNEYTSYLKIAEGCNNNCTYCTIPKIRGRLNSRPIEDLVKEVKQMIDRGIKEIIIIAQDITQYGVDIYGESKLVSLLEKLVNLKGLKWIRLLYAYPERIDDKLINLIKKEDKICNYLDIPIQHSVEKIRKKMGRKGSSNELVNLIEKIRNKIPDIVLRTSLIVGFPQETENDFEQLVEFVKNMRFSRLGVFQFSREEGTPAFHMEGQIEEKTKELRFNKIMQIQQQISLENNKKLIGKKLEVLVIDKKDSYYLARSQYDAPEIDNQIYLEGESLSIGDFVKCKITGAKDYDLFATEIRES
ncbi:MAG: 30S ribosomal protein S12 methylthiotransferase RimO [Bacillota bacterium]